MTSRPAPRNFIIYKTFIFLAIVGRTREADTVISQQGSAIYKVAAYLRQKYPVRIKHLYRGMLVPPKDVPADRMAQPYGVGFASFTEDLQAACWFADPQVNLASLVMLQKPDAEGWLGIYLPQQDEILYHYSWLDPLQNPPGPNIYQLILDLVAAQGWPQELLAEFKYHAEHQQEVILTPNIVYPLKPIGDYNCLSSQELDNSYTPRPDWVTAPPGMDQFGIQPGSRLYIDRAEFHLTPIRCKSCKSAQVSRTYHFKGSSIKADSCGQCGYVWSLRI